jgi:hypothetical protein
MMSSSMLVIPSNPNSYTPKLMCHARLRATNISVAVKQCTCTAGALCLRQSIEA